MRSFFLLLLFCLAISCMKKQKEFENFTDKGSSYQGFDAVKHNPKITDLEGTWSISELIESVETKEYWLYPNNGEQIRSGNYISLHPDQTFVSGYTAFCGNDCFTNTKGKYKIIDKNYICFYLEKITKSGDCSGNFTPNRDLGLYYYYKKDSIFCLLKSNGNLEQDKKNVQYRDLVTAKRAEVQKFYRSDSYNSSMFNWKRTDYTDEIAIVAFCMAENKIKNYELLYYDKGDRYCTMAMALVKIKGEFCYVIYNTGGNPMVSLYDDSKVLQTDKWMNQIDDDKSLNVKSFRVKNRPNESPFDKKTITVVKKENEIYKVTYVNYPKDLEHFYVFTLNVYFQNSKPIYFDYESAAVRKNDNYAPKLGLYILDWENNKVLVKNINGGGTYLAINWMKKEIDRIMDEIKTKNL
ncbi:hypothetical protein [Flavobacterium sp. LC2016-01]|uniref:hypothetical protein n=1 Tax=Flavobacterium sp. LC2016-01 TaxID=2675876 RepID=UPI0012BA832D|nr:hypothetical protein [Flavobacterium sp. LC2016-01]MTH16583.1 hypothetical protein [Flavobacterium sp. LC2016-01]